MPNTKTKTKKKKYWQRKCYNLDTCLFPIYHVLCVTITCLLNLVDLAVPHYQDQRASFTSVKRKLRESCPDFPQLSAGKLR
jgi:hypothetical protein